MKRLLKMLSPFICTCKIPGGPAAHYEVHDRGCIVSRIATKRHWAHLDPKTNWVTIP